MHTSSMWTSRANRKDGPKSFTTEMELVPQSIIKQHKLSSRNLAVPGQSMRILLLEPSGLGASVAYSSK